MYECLMTPQLKMNIGYWVCTKRISLKWNYGNLKKSFEYIYLQTLLIGCTVNSVISGIVLVYKFKYKNYGT